MSSLVGLAACTGSEDAPAVTLNPFTPTGTATASSLPPTATEDADDRTGNEDVGAVIDAVTSGDAATIAALVELQTMGCTTAQGAGGPPKCEVGDPAGTEYDVLPLVTCEG